MKIIDTSGTKQTSVIVELQKPIASILFSSSLAIEDLAKETINIRVVRPNKGDSVLIHNEDISLSAFLLASTMTGNPIGSNPLKGYETQCVIPLTIGGNIPLSDNDVIRFELKALSKDATYVLDGIQASYNAVHAMTYIKKNSAKDNTNIDFPVQSYDLAVLQLTNDITAIDIRYTNGFLSSLSIDEFKDLLNRTHGVAQIKSDGTLLQSFTNFVQIPLIGITMLTVKKDTATDVTNLYLRNNLLN
jgi:hypothetical protein